MPSPRHDARPRRLLTLFLALALLGSALAGVPLARAAGPCEVTSGGDSGPGSLREKLADASCGTITFQPFLFEIRISDRLVISRDVILDGPGIASLGITYYGAAKPSGSIVWVRRGEVVIRGMQLSGGHTAGIWGAGLTTNGDLGATRITLESVVVSYNRAANAGGGGIYVSNANLTIKGSVIANNIAANAAHDVGWGGGGIFVDDFYGTASVTVSDSTVIGNQAPHNVGGGIRVWDRADGKFASLTLNNTTVGGEAGSGLINTAGREGGGIDNYGGMVTLNKSTVSGNTARSGGGIDNYQGRVTLNNSTVIANAAADPTSPFFYPGGGGIYNTGTLILHGSTVKNNTADPVGGGIYNRGTVELTESTIFDNLADRGGGLYNHQATATLKTSTLAANRATLHGAALYNDNGALALLNSTITSNGAYAKGGGLYNIAGTATLTAVTVVENWSGDPGGGGGIYTFPASGVLTATNLGSSLIVGNTGNHFGAPNPPTSSDCAVGSGGYLPHASLGDNVVGSNTGCPIDGPNDLATDAPRASIYETSATLDGPTLVHALVAGSPAVDHVPTRVCPSVRDQRGVGRPQGPACDTGAYERGPFIVLPSPSPSPALSPSPSPNPSPSLPGFGDVPPGDPAEEAIGQLAARGIINGCDPTAAPPLFCPGDTTLRHQMAALIVRAMPGWQGETWPNTFTDPTDDAELWRRVGTLQHYGVVTGYTAESCVAQGKVPPCYGPLDPVLKAQAISFVTRAMVAKGYWAQQPTDPNLYGGALIGTGHEQDASTYWHYTRARGGVPDYPEDGTFPALEEAPRGWFARLLWTAIQGTPAAP